MQISLPQFLLLLTNLIRKISLGTFLGFLGFLFSISSTAQNASFTSIPAAVNGVITICKNQTITYTNTSTGTSSNTNYSWAFQGGNTTSSTTFGPHTITYTTAGNYTTTLTIGNSVSTVNVVVQNVIGNIASISIDPNYTSFGYSTTTNNGQDIIRYCGCLLYTSDAADE
jgi:hypothetical protein